MRGWRAKAATAFRIILAASLMAQVSPALAHHSFAAYDMTREETAKGTIKEFRWGAPHCAVVITIQQPDGTTKDLLLVAVAPAIFAQQGFNPKSFHSGDMVEVTWHPNRNGSDGGSLKTLTLPDGRVFHETEFMPPPDTPPGGLPPGVLPPGGLPPGVLPPDGLPPGVPLPGGLPPGAPAPGGLPPDALPPALLPPQK